MKRYVPEKILLFSQISINKQFISILAHFIGFERKKEEKIIFKLYAKIYKEEQLSYKEFSNFFTSIHDET